MGYIFPFLLVGAVYFLMLRPQQQRVARQRELIAALQPGDEVVTAGGIVGRVRNLDEQHIWLEVAPGVELTLLRGAIAQKVQPPSIDDDLAELEGRSVDGDDRSDEGFNGH